MIDWMMVIDGTVNIVDRHVQHSWCTTVGLYKVRIDRRFFWKTMKATKCMLIRDSSDSKPANVLMCVVGMGIKICLFTCPLHVISVLENIKIFFCRPSVQMLFLMCIYKYIPAKLSRVNMLKARIKAYDMWHVSARYKGNCPTTYAVAKSR